MANDAYALECAAGEGHESFVRLMLRYYPELAKEVAVGVTSQGPDSSIKTQAITDILFEHGMDADHTDWLGIRPLHRFAQRGDITSAAVFLEHGADIDAIDGELCTSPLGWAAKAGKEEMVRFLLEKGAEINIPAVPEWSTPLAWAQKRGHTEIEKILRKAGAV